MGVGYYAQVSQWSKGEYADANNTQDDLQIIANRLTYRTDDHEDVDFALATPLTISNNIEVHATNPVTDPDNLNPVNKGIIEDRSDVDLFYMDVGAGQVNLSVTPAWTAAYTAQSRRGMNVDIEAVLYDSVGNPVASSDVSGDTYAQLNTSVGGGRYVLAIKGVGAGNPLNTGYSDYGSLGQYFITGTVPEDQIYTTAPTAPSDLTAVASGDTSIQLSWTDPQSTPESNESGYRVYMQKDGGSFIEIASLAQDSLSFSDNNLTSGSYVYYVQPYNSVGSNDSNLTQAVVIAAPSVAHAGSENSVAGTIVSGSYFSTTTVSGHERLSEQHQGGKPRNRVSQLEHVWAVYSVEAAASVSLMVDAMAEANSENDNYEFAYSVNGSPYAVFNTLNNGTGRQSFSVELPPGTVGTVEVRVRDTDRTKGRGKEDALEVYYIAVTSSGEPGDQMPVVTIESPADNSEYSLGSHISFSASATDMEDDDQQVTNAIVWRSNIDNTIGSGPSLETNSLSVGTHTITAETTDSAGNTGSDVCTVIVTDPSAPVLIVSSITPSPISLAALKAIATMTITGTGFETGAQVSLANGSGPVPAVSNVWVDNSSIIRVDITAGNGGPNKRRYWDVIVTNPGGGSATCSGCLVIDP